MECFSKVSELDWSWSQDVKFQSGVGVKNKTLSSILRATEYSVHVQNRLQKACIFGVIFLNDLAKVGV